MRKKMIFFIIVFIFALAAGGLCFFLGWQKPVNEGRIVVLKVESGMSASQIAQLLEEKGIIRSARVFLAQTKARGMENALQAGEYELISGMTEQSILEKMASGDVRTVKFTIPEGFNVKEIAALLAKNGLAGADEFLAAAKDYTPYEYMKTGSRLIEYKSEGFLFPSTYSVSASAGGKAILAMLVREFDQQLTKDMREKLRKKNMSVRDFVTLASLVEKEAAVAEDRKFIAKAFLKRLDIDMPLQSCATIQYILGYPKPELTIADTKLPSEYNTYLHYGLPPGPIANPGLLSMQSVLNPAKEDYLYFVAQKNGQHIFSYTYDEHLQAIEKASR
ncbi:MAG: endolytic transglycosylase MltG [Acidaminococcales bacterium]|jgi:UPF0755 protein|nr:endolytic transglycosylase MltG [Acidaminococcales bacterium]